MSLGLVVLEKKLFTRTRTPTPQSDDKSADIKSKDSLVDPASVTVLSSVESQDMDPAVSSHNSSTDLSLPQHSFRKELQDLDEKWSVRMARLEAL